MNGHRQVIVDRYTKFKKENPRANEAQVEEWLNGIEMLCDANMPFTETRKAAYADHGLWHRLSINEQR